MTRTISFIIVTMCLFSQVFAQSVGVKMGTLIDSQNGQFHTQRVEAVFAYPLSQKLDVSFTTGYYRQHLDGYTETLTFENGSTTTQSYSAITHQFIPVIAGLKYSFSHDLFAPYLILEYGKYFDVANKGELQARYGRFKDDFNFATIFRVGSGLQYQIQGNFLVDFSAKYMTDSNFSDSVELMAGVCFQL